MVSLSGVIANSGLSHFLHVQDTPSQGAGADPGVVDWVSSRV